MELFGLERHSSEWAVQIVRKPPAQFREESQPTALGQILWSYLVLQYPDVLVRWGIDSDDDINPACDPIFIRNFAQFNVAWRMALIRHWQHGGPAPARSRSVSALGLWGNILVSQDDMQLVFVDMEYCTGVLCLELPPHPLQTISHAEMRATIAATLSYPLGAPMQIDSPAAAPEFRLPRFWVVWKPNHQIVLADLQLLAVESLSSDPDLCAREAPAIWEFLQGYWRRFVAEQTPEDPLHGKDLLVLWVRNKVPDSVPKPADEPAFPLLRVHRNCFTM